MTYNCIDEDSFSASFYDNVFNFDIDLVYLNEMTDIIKKNECFFIEIMKKYSPKFDLKKMNVMYILPVYIGLAEMYYLTEEIPAKVSLNEAVELAKAFGDDSAKKIVNGVLHNVYTNYEDFKTLSTSIQKTNDFSLFKKSLI
ncbi:MAG: transcription antitermination protein NusB [Candidatus Gracilibacteria bacterium]|nr:transcription antitermination protein NusB [Candidatus Gracilibacteria bacterium]